MSSSLLTALQASPTRLDLDCNDAAFGRAFSASLASSASSARVFCDMTSNSLLVLAEIAAADGARVPLLEESVRTAKALLQGKLQGGEKVLSFGLDGLDDDEKLQWLAVDVMTVSLGLQVLPHLQPRGMLHAQIACSLGTASAIEAHARRLSALYILLSRGNVSHERICIKIPSTLAGLEACARLEKDGIRTLATTCFSLEQALAADTAGCRYVAPYINALEAHFYEVEKPSVRRHADTSEALAIVARLQRALRRRQSRTEVVSASFLSLTEVFSLLGVDTMTLSRGVLTLLRDTPASDELVALGRASERRMDPASLSADAAQAEADEDTKAATPEALAAALSSERCAYLVADALARFTKAEEMLRALVRAEVARGPAAGDRA